MVEVMEAGDSAAHCVGSLLEDNGFCEIQDNTREVA